MTLTRTLLPVLLVFGLVSPALAGGPGNPGEGKKIFQQNCVVCHGPEGKGDGPAAAGLNPKPANFSDPVRAAQMTEDKQLRIVKGGGPSEKLSPVMPSFGDALTDQQIKDVVAFVRSNSSSGVAVK